MNNLTFGRFTPYNTPVHRLDPRNKILLMILLLVAVFLRVNSWSTTLIMGGILLVILLLFMAISKINIMNLFKSLKAMWFLLLFLLIIYVFIPNPTYDPTHVAFMIGTYAVNYDAFYQVGYIILRIVMMLELGKMMCIV